LRAGQHRGRCERLDAKAASFGAREIVDDLRRGRREGERAARLVDSSRSAVQRCHKAFQLTASNCQNGQQLPGGLPDGVPAAGRRPAAEFPVGAGAAGGQPHR